MDNTLITQDRLDEMVRLAGITPQSGSFAEVGVYKGGSLKELNNAFPDRYILGFDTFQGLPKEHWREDEPHKAGEFGDTDFMSVFNFVACPHVHLVQGFFPDTAKIYEEIEFAFVHVDTDFYLSVKACIAWFWPRLLPGGIMVFDDYEWPNCPGVKQALEESGLQYFKTKADYQAYIQKPKYK